MLMQKPDSTRSSDRKRLDLLVQGRMRSRTLYVEVVDVSEGGCKIKGRHGFAEEGEIVSLKIDGVRTPLGKIVWVDREFAGIAFDGKMHPAVVDHLYNQRRLQKQEQDRDEKAA